MRASGGSAEPASIIADSPPTGDAHRETQALWTTIRPAIEPGEAEPRRAVAAGPYKGPRPYLPELVYSSAPPPRRLGRGRPTATCSWRLQRRGRGGARRADPAQDAAAPPARLAHPGRHRGGPRRRAGHLLQGVGEPCQVRRALEPQHLDLPHRHQPGDRPPALAPQPRARRRAGAPAPARRWPTRSRTASWRASQQSEVAAHLPRARGRPVREAAAGLPAARGRGPVLARGGRDRRLPRVDGAQPPVQRPQASCASALLRRYPEYASPQSHGQQTEPGQRTKENA